MMENASDNVDTSVDEVEDEGEQLVEEEESKRTCWICSATDEEDEDAVWVHPCRCSGTTKWVHKGCIIQRWVGEKLNGNMYGEVLCPHCNTEYVSTFPCMSPVVTLMDIVDIVISRMCPFAAAGIVLGSIYALSVTFGTITVIQVFGRYEGLYAVARADTSVCLVGLPSILLLLILSNMVPWEEMVLRFLRKHSNKLPLLGYFFPGYSEVTHVPPMTGFEYATRVLCGALMLPTVAIRVGETFFASVQSNLNRALLGGLAFMTIKGVLKMYRMQQQYLYPPEIIDYPG